eukprot:1160745-Pelagomonas_calceolata.AAC.12
MDCRLTVPGLLSGGGCSPNLTPEAADDVIPALVAGGLKGCTLSACMCVSVSVCMPKIIRFNTGNQHAIQYSFLTLCSHQLFAKFWHTRIKGHMLPLPSVVRRCKVRPDTRGFCPPHTPLCIAPPILLSPNSSQLLVKQY